MGERFARSSLMPRARTYTAVLSIAGAIALVAAAFTASAQTNAEPGQSTTTTEAPPTTATTTPQLLPGPATTTTTTPAHKPGTTTTSSTVPPPGAVVAGDATP